MSAKKNVVRVTVAGEEYTIRSDAPTDHTQAVARYVEQVLRRIASSAPIVESHKVAVMAAMQIADELLRLRGESEELTAAMQALSDDVRRWLPPAKRGPTPTSVQAVAPDPE